MTVPDQTMTARQILDRFAAGMPASAHVYTPTYNGDKYVPDFKNMDLADIEEYRRQASEDIERHRATLAEEQREHAKKQREKDLNDLKTKLERERTLLEKKAPEEPKNAD